MENDEAGNGDTSASPPRDEATPYLKTKLYLDKVGEVVATLRPDGLSWESLDDSLMRQSTCLGLKVFQGVVTEIKLADTYSVELINYGLVRGPNILKVGKLLLGRDSPNHEMYRFMLRSVRKSTSQPSVLVPTTCIFGHEDLQTCQTWVERVDASLKSEFGRPKNLMVFVNPKSGKTNGYKTWESVSPIFSHAKVKTNGGVGDVGLRSLLHYFKFICFTWLPQVIVTQRAGHAFDVMASTANDELNSYDGFICVGGDGFFNELLNGFLLSRLKAPYPPCPSDLVHYDESDASAPDSERGNAEISGQNEEQFHLLPDSTQNRYKATSIEDGSHNSDQDADFSFEKFRFGIIPAGSTDAIVMCTTGARDPVTSALHIVLGKRLHLDLAQVVSWKSSATSEARPRVRYAASFAGYGFYGDVITESEKYRWMGPKRYDYAGTKVFMRHRSYEAEIAYMESESEKSNYKLDKGSLLSRVKDICIPDKSERTICRANCGVCNMKPLNVPKRSRGKPYSRPEGYKWRKCKGHFLSVGAAIMSNRNERAPDGLVADAHLSDGFLHLLLIRDCPRAHYLCHLTQLAKRGGRPLNFGFVEHHKTSAFTFTSLGEESVWNLDGELFPARQLSAQVFRGLVSLFASGPEV